MSGVTWSKARTCLVPGCTTRTTSGRCGKHQHRGKTTRVRTLASTTARGYGTAHMAARKAALAALVDGQSCAQCRQDKGVHHPMYRSAAAQLDLSHSDDRTHYIGMSWAKCNRAAAARKVNAQRRKQQVAVPIRYSRVW